MWKSGKEIKTFRNQNQSKVQVCLKEPCKKNQFLNNEISIVYRNEYKHCNGTYLPLFESGTFFIVIGEE